jgi:hypothetical protein
MLGHEHHVGTLYLSEHFSRRIWGRNTLHVGTLTISGRNTKSEHFTCRNTFHVGSAPHVGTLFLLGHEHHVGKLYLSEHFSCVIGSEHVTCPNTYNLGSEHQVGTLYMSEHIGSELHVGTLYMSEHFSCRVGTPCRNTFPIGS